jgi:hypothetical protein
VHAASPMALNHPSSRGHVLFGLAFVLLEFHRNSFDGECTTFHRLGSCFVRAAAMPLGAGIVRDLYVAVAKASVRRKPASSRHRCILIVLWLVEPLRLRAVLRMTTNFACRQP